MKKLNLYLETTIFNRYFEDGRPFHTETRQLFREIAEGCYLPFTSAYVIDEMVKAPEPKRTQMLALLKQYHITVLEKSTETALLAQLYVSRGVIPEKYFYDGLHIASAAVNNLDVVLSLNFQHINKLKTRTMTESINKERYYRAVEICSPMEVIEYED